MHPQMTTSEGLFSPSFTCFGPEIGVAAPGVAIVSSVPGGGFDPQSGTSMAAPHVCGMAALMLAHHPALRAMPRDASRVSALFQMMKASAMPLPFGPERSGAGMPSLLNVMQGFLSDAAESDEENELELASAGPRTRRAGRTRRSTAPQTPSFGGYQAILVPQPAPVYRPQGFFFG
jgi:subtilisin family serine protease